ncbi:MAG: hypothetical protein LBS70_09935 [Candidatus Accumulibacter sp.]|nr:hypothetical protein [Accumulibacter sp.]
MTSNIYFKLADEIAQRAIGETRQTLTLALAEFERGVKRFELSESANEKAWAINNLIGFLVGFIPSNLHVELFATAQAEFTLARNKADEEKEGEK